MLICSRYNQGVVVYKIGVKVLFQAVVFMILDSQFGLRCATKKYFQRIGSIHDIESSFGIDNHTSFNVQSFGYNYCMGIKESFSHRLEW